MNDETVFRVIPNLRATPTSDDPGDSAQYLVTGSVNGEMFELGEEELFLLRLIDGNNTQEEILDRLFDRFGLTLSKENLLRFIRQMYDYGLLEKVAAGEIETSSPRRETARSTPSETIDLLPEVDGVMTRGEDRRERERGDRGAFQIKMFNPSMLFSLLDAIFSPFSFLVWLLIPGIFVAVMILVNHHVEYMQDLDIMETRFGLTSFLPHMLLALITSRLLSKLSQGTVCVHFGGLQERFGIRFLFGFIPRFYIDAHHIRKLSRRGQLWSYAAPLLTKLMLFASGITVWFVWRESATLLAQFALFLGSVGLVGFLFTVNPLWKADGYNWLCTRFRAEGLQERAFLVLKHFVLFRSLPKELPTLKKYGLLLYGLASIAFTVFIIIAAFLLLAISLEKHLGGLGVCCFFVLLYLFGSWLTARWNKRRVRAAQRQQLDSAPPDSRAPAVFAVAGTDSGSLPDRPGSQSLGAHPDFKPSKRGKRRIKAILKRFIFLALLGLLAWVLFLPYQYEPGGSVIISPIRKYELHARATGEVMEIRVREGDYVEADQVLAKLDDWELNKQITLTETELEKKQAQLELLLEGSKSEEVELARKRYEEAKMLAESSQKEVERLEPLLKDNFISQKRYDDARTDAAERAAEFKVAEANLLLMESGPRSNEIKVLEAEIQFLKQRIQFAEEELEKTLIIAPAYGRITTQKLEEKLGSVLEEGDLFAVMENTRDVKAEILVPESDIGDVRLGARVEVKVYTYPDRSFFGTVTATSPALEDMPDNPFVRVARVTTEISNADNLLKSEMTGYAKIEGEEMFVVVAFSRMLVRFVLVEAWSWLP